MHALITVLVLAQASVTLGIGGKTKLSDSVRIERERKADSVRMRYEERRDSVFAARRNGDSTENLKRRAKQIQLTPALLANAFRDPGAASLLSSARRARLEQDSLITGYDATTYERMSVGLGLRRVGRERLLLRTERAAHVTWSRGGPAYAEIVGRRSAAPMFDQSEITLGDAVPIPYYPGRETLWVGSGLAKSDIDESEIIHPLARGAEAYYTYATGDSVSFQIPGAERIKLRELIIRPRAPKWNVALGSLWFDTSNSKLVRAVYRLAEPMDIWAKADEDAEDKDDRPPGWVKGMINPLRAQVTAVTVEYGLHEGRFWMPRTQAMEGSVQAGFMRAPFSVEQRFKYASVNGALPVPIPDIAVGDTATDSVSRAARIARRRTACRDGGASMRTVRRNAIGLPIIIRVSCDTVALAHSAELPPSIYDDGDEVFGGSDRDELIDAALALGAQPGWLPQKPVFIYGLSQTRFNKIEGLSSGIAARQSLGRGYSARAAARIGIADLQPNGMIGISRSNGRSTIGINAYRRLASANDWTDPFSLGASLSALLFGRDEGFYYRTAGLELSGTPDDSATTTWRLFAEHHGDARTKTSFSLAKAIGGDGFDDNIDATQGNVVGVAGERHLSRGLNPRGLRLFGTARGEAATGTFDYAKAMLDATVSRSLTQRFDGAFTLAAGTSHGSVPVQRLWYLGGSQTVRGQPAGTQVGNAFWLARAELGMGSIAARPVIFYDAGWAGERKKLNDHVRPMSGAGVGVSFLDGLVRFDVARGIYPEKKFRANMYFEARF